MRHRFVPQLAALLAVSLMPAFAAAPEGAGAAAPVLGFVDNGVSIDAGSMGSFVLQFPAPGADPDHALALVEKRIAGNHARLSYEGGAAIDATIGPGGTLTLSVTALPATARTIRLEMLIPYDLGLGGTWQAGDDGARPFPAESPASPYLYQAETDRFRFRNADVGTLSLAFPRAFAQLQDNRAWNWKTFDWWVAMPITPGAHVYTITISAAAATPRARVDAFGQSLTQDFPDKVTSAGQLQADVDSERRWLASLHPAPRDSFGGLPGTGATLGLSASGFFHVETKAARWYLVDPQGNAFFQLGVCSFGPSDDYTHVGGRERAYAWLPERTGTFGSAFRSDDSTAFSFHLANWIRKTGRPFALDDYLTTMIARARAWGFNSSGAFSPVFQPAQTRARWPYVTSLPLSRWDGFPQIPGVAGAWDPFDADNRRRVEQRFAERVAPHADERLLIGYFLGNEPLYEKLPQVLPTLDGSFACKRRLVDMLHAEYSSIAAFDSAWGLKAGSFDELVDRGLDAGTTAARRDVRDFADQFLEEYYRLVQTAFHRYDAHHLLLGSRFQRATIDDEQRCRICGRYVDVVSFNYYTFGIDAGLLSRIHAWSGNRPLLLSEFSYFSPSDSRLPGGGWVVTGQAQRGLAYRNYVEQAAALGTVVGIEWFTLVDQSLTGRYFESYNGENANTGLIGVTDRPWRAMLEPMSATNDSIADVLFGRRPPYALDDPRFR